MTSSDANAREKAVAAALARHQSPNPPPPIPPRPASLPTSLSAPSPTAAASYSSSVDPLRSLIVFVVGAPGSGKTTQCAALAKQFDCHHIVFDEYVRQAIQYAHTKSAKQRSHGQPAASDGSAAASTSLVSGFQPTLSSSQISTLVRSTASASSTSSKQPIPSLLRSRLLYQAMQYLSEQQPLFRFLVDGYLDSEDDWNEWAALVNKRKAEREQVTQGQDGKRGSQQTSPSMVIGFLPPIILRLVCSESVGQLRWRRAQLLQRDQLTSTAALPSSAEVKARSMRYSLRTRPMIYRLGMVAEELMARKRIEVKAEDDDEDDEDDDEDDLAAMDGMIVKRVDAEVPLEQCYSDIQELMEQIVRHTRDSDWTRITGYNSDDDEDVIVVPFATPALAVTVATASTTTATSTSSPAVPIESAVTVEPLVEVAEEQQMEESPSPDAVNWEEDPEEAKEREDREREEKDRLERYERMLRLIEAEEEKWRLGLEREEAKERERMEEEIRKLREREEEVAAEPGHIATRRDDRFTTFISFTVAVSLLLTGGQAAAGGAERDVWVEVYRGFEREERPGELRWVSVVKSAKLPVSGVGVAGLTVAFPRLIVNTWRLSGNEKERPVMFRLFAAQPKPTAPPAAAPANAPKAVNAQLIGETRTILSHMLVPPEEKGLTLTLRRPPATNAPPSAYLLISPAALHTLLAPRKIVPPTRLHTVLAERPVIPAVIPVTPSNAVSREQSPVRQREAGKSDPIKTPQPRQGEEKEREREARGQRSEEKERDKKKVRGRHREKDGSRKRNKSVSDLKTESKQREKEEEEEMERMLREIDEQIGITTRRRAASFNARVPVPLQVGGAAGAAQPAAAAGVGQAAGPSTGRRSLVDEMRSTISRLSVSATQRNNNKPSGGRKASKKESKAEKERLQLLAQRRKRKREEAIALRRRAESRERRRKELARIKRKAAVIKVSLLSVDCACMNLPVESKRQSLFSSKIEVRYYLQVYRKRDKVKEKERERKMREKRGGSIGQSVKVPDMYGPDVRNCCCHPQHRHLLKPSLFTLVYSSPLVSTAAPAFAPFLIPLDDQPLLFVVFASSCNHRNAVPSSAASGGGPSTATVFSSVEHDGKDRIVAMSRLSVEDVVKMALIQQREWEVDVYGLVEREKEREHRREAKLREVDRRRERGESVDSQWEEEEDRMEEEKERAMSEKHRVSVRLREPAAIEREREARKAKRAERKRARDAAAGAAGPAAAEAGDDSDSDDSEGEESTEPVTSTVPLLSFFSLAFYSTRPVNKDAQRLVEFVPRSRTSVSGQARSQVGAQASRGSFTVRGSAPAASAVASGQ